ncbi:double-stranded RNA binding domain-containing protein family protein, variant [Loa loa]|uniref:Double-stranded RNA binding domain-containing protein family protein n=1 Tax=Loa loa TaxID=7209 RepID=A0A1S0UKU1_LOALO|nr:double-stranded RNA binding domain-containing protein family protein [Loa loa]XP_020306818.1 double-stranded RNA binding domain-containing protein family protein, variant [Loa loa]EJD75988.1 double-stranded RNA binding domain-containing protein family protein [Loa loa]EJD75989.1 double-stranded RNA binding domain-containing protein family protein, variant [Loa loa]
MKGAGVQRTKSGTTSDDSILHPEMWWGQSFTEQEVSPTKYVYNYSQMDENHQRTPMCRIAELARYNKIRHEYKLMDESGPAHKKQFTVSLVLTPDQVFYGKGASIKKAQQSAAETALNGTILPKPPDKIPSKKIKSDFQNPVVLLKYVAGRLGVEIKFIDEVVPICPSPQHPITRLPMQPLIRTPFIPVINEQFLVFPPPRVLFGQPRVPAALQPNSRYRSDCISFFCILSSYSKTNCRPLIRTPFIPVINEQFLVFPPPRVLFGQPRVPAALQPVPVMMRPPNAVIPPRFSFFHRYRSPSQLHKVRLILSKDFPEFIGKGITKKRAKNSAANEALSYLGPYLATLEAQSKSKVMNGSKNELMTVEIENIRKDHLKSVVTTARNGKPKSSISQIHECALQMRMNVEFLVLKEEGPAHDRHYLLRCKLISAEQIISADGEGSSKKIAKQNACSLMLTKLQSIESSPVFIAAAMLKSQKKIGAPKELKRKTISKDMKMNPEYGHQINPVSRLMQVMQARKQNEPKFQLVAERGQSRYKEFVMEVVCDDGLRCEGIGPNKKLAKRAAAEAVLARIGYVKPMPKPGKSLLKKKPEEYMQQTRIGMFELEKEGKLVLQVNENEDEASVEKVSEVTLSVTASMGSQVMAFADVDRTLYAGERKGVRGITAAETKSISDQENSNARQRAAQPKRHVTFSNEVSACPPSDDGSYPSAFITPLKSDVVVVNKLRKKGRDSKKWLTEIEKKEIAEMAQEFFKCCNIIHTLNIDEKLEGDGFVLVGRQMGQMSLNEMPSSTAYSAARRHLGSIAEHYKFSVNYTDFPVTPSGIGDQYFSLISIGIDKPVVCHGSGNTEEAAHENAARNALLLLCKIWMVY